MAELKAIDERRAIALGMEAAKIRIDILTRAAALLKYASGIGVDPNFLDELISELEVRLADFGVAKAKYLIAKEKSKKSG